MRKIYFDIVKIGCILLLIPLHHLLMYNSVGEGKYVIGASSDVATFILALFLPWCMKVLFVIGGMSARYSLDKRSGNEYITERFLRIGLPFFAGMLLLVPFMAYIGDITNNDYSGGYWEHYKIFFTRHEECRAYCGGFATTHLWFLIYLLLVSLIVFPIYLLCKKFPKFFKWNGWSMPLILLLGVLHVVPHGLIQATYVTFTQYLSLFLIGMFVLSHDEVQEKLERYRFRLLISALFFCIAYSAAMIINAKTSLAISASFISLMEFSYGFMTTLAFIGLASRHLNIQNRILIHAGHISQLFYLFHYPVLVAIAFVIMPRVENMILQIILVNVISFILTYLAAEAARMTPFVRILFGMKQTK